jgi:hypothetical protein
MQVTSERHQLLFQILQRCRLGAQRLIVSHSPPPICLRGSLLFACQPALVTIVWTSATGTSTTVPR